MANQNSLNKKKINIKLFLGTLKKIVSMNSLLVFNQLDRSKLTHALTAGFASKVSNPVETNVFPTLSKFNSSQIEVRM